MKSLSTILAISTATLLTACAGPIGAPGHMAGRHRPAADSAPVMQEHLEHMQTMRDKMSRAQSPQERQALMEEHMKAMRNGMDSLKRMEGLHGKPGPAMDFSQRQQRMEAQMDMMQTMMDMMLQRMPR
ncbi:hypothetical protein [Hydrogenophaga sp. BPS33]|uniref:hypothetical protein n=1 Tax=Hydrogenophaga sp. BPS33 TaxID=2651974 RepID=UPI00131FA3BD|nr:hypothetical protein [Hydrogenophaga sp. BPS33]QHE86128.1 hypothetical protein F9K07_15050 [Hydrogenophaga sp. BPS33]